LVGCVTLVLQTNRLDVPETIPERDVLERELLAFRETITATGKEKYEADWRSRQHDDIVLGLAVALFCGERPDPNEPVSFCQPIPREHAPFVPCVVQPGGGRCLVLPTLPPVDGMGSLADAIRGRR
jgi:hypothetical protein